MGHKKRILSIILTLCMLAGLVYPLDIVPPVQIQAAESDDDWKIIRNTDSSNLNVVYADLLMSNEKPEYMYQENFGLPADAFWSAAAEKRYGITFAAKWWEFARGNYDTIYEEGYTFYEACLLDLIRYQVEAQEQMNLVYEKQVQDNPKSLDQIKTDFDAAHRWLEALDGGVNDSLLHKGLEAYKELEDLPAKKAVSLMVQIGEVLDQDEAGESKGNNSDANSSDKKTEDSGNGTSKEDETSGNKSTDSGTGTSKGNDTNGNSGKNTTEKQQKKVKEIYNSLADSKIIEKGKIAYEWFERAISVAKTVDELMTYIEKYKQLSQLNDGILNVLTDMQRNVGSIQYRTSLDKEYMNQALNNMIKASKKVDIDELIFETAFRETTRADIRLIGSFTEKLLEMDPLLKVVKGAGDAVLEGVDIVFHGDDAFYYMQMSMVSNQVHELIYKGMQRAQNNFKNSKTEANANMYVSYTFFLTDSYVLLLDNFKNIQNNLKNIKNMFEAYDAYYDLITLQSFELPWEAVTKTNKNRERILDGITSLKSGCFSDLTSYYELAMYYCSQNQKAKLQAVNQKKQSDSAVIYRTSTIKVTEQKAPDKTIVQKQEAQQKKTTNLITNQVFNSGKTVKLEEDLETFGDVYLTNGVLDLNGHTLTVHSNFYHSGGHLYIHDGTLDIKGSYIVQRENGTDADDNIKYTSAYASIKMTGSKDKMSVGGDFYWNSNRSWSNRNDAGNGVNVMKAGTLIVSGDFLCNSTFSPMKDHVVMLSGGHSHKIQMKGSGTYFNILKFQKTGNKSEKKNDNTLYWEGPIVNLVLQDDVTLYPAKEEEAGDKYRFLCIIGKLDVNGHVLTMNGDICHTQGQLDFNKGTVQVNGDYACKAVSGYDNDKNPVYSSAYAALKMKDTKDTMIIGGDFEWRSNRNFTEDMKSNSADTNMMRAGTMKVAGDFVTDQAAFRPSDRHIVELIGSKKQIVSLGNSKLNILKVSRPMSNYRFKPENCYKSMDTALYNISFIANGADKGSMDMMKNLKYGKSYQLNKNSFTRKGYVFEEWNTKPNGTGISYKNKANVKDLLAYNGKTVVLYAQWKKK